MSIRQAYKDRTRAKAIAAAQKAFSVSDYHSVGIRKLAQMMGMSTGAIFANFASKADLWRASMGGEPPADTAVDGFNIHLNRL